jgi:hypothetical protein
MGTCRGRFVQWIPTADVKPGDQLACFLSDASAFPEVTGWADRELALSRFGLADVTHREFTVRDAPWWVRTDNFMLTSDLAGETLVLGIGPAENKWP